MTQATVFVEELRPSEVARRVAANGLVFVPVSPCCEWHGYHLPLGTDGLIVEAVSVLLAQSLGAVSFRCLSCGLDAWRSEAFLASQGYSTDVPAFGMNLPGLPVASEYVARPALEALVRARLDTARASGFCHAFLVNHHGGEGQRETLEALAADAASPAFHATCLMPGRFCTCVVSDELAPHLRIGGHAGLLETTQLLAFRPELVDLDEIPDGALNAAHEGILHASPTIPPEYNPRRALKALADAYRHNVVANLLAEVRSLSGMVPRSADHTEKESTP